MITRDEADYTAKQEASTSTDHGSSSSINLNPTSASWLRLKDPRIVRVSRAFGGKDRHSKVRTVKGLRDRRVRLSVSTAIQLYDLQDRLGLNQPSKVFDWLLDAAKDEIDELPPLQIPPESFMHSHHHLMQASHGAGPSSTSTAANKADTDTSFQDPIFGLHRSNIWSADDALLEANNRSNNKDVSRSEEVANNGKQQHRRTTTRTSDVAEEENHNKVQGGSPNNNSFLPRLNHFTVPGSGYGTSTVTQCNPYYWEASNFSVASAAALASQTTDAHSFNVVPFPQALSLQSGPSQVLVCPPGMQSYFPSSGLASATSAELNQRQFLQMLSSNSTSTAAAAPHLFASQSMMRPPLHLSMNMPSQNELNKGSRGAFPSK